MSAPQGQVSLEDLNPEQLQRARLLPPFPAAGRRSPADPLPWTSPRSNPNSRKHELKHLTQAFGNLKAAQSKFSSCMEAVDAIKPANKDKKILIPLTSSLYVPGRIKDTENVIVDVGTGYFVEKSAKAAKTLFNSKILELRKNLATLQEQIERKNDNARAVGEVLRIKLSKERQKGGAQGGGPQQD